MAKREPVSEEGMQRLAKYWFRAELMHEFLHTLREVYKGDLDKLKAEGHWWEFEAYLSYWLSGLFVVVEGFNKLKLEDAGVKRLMGKPLTNLKGLRHETYHFMMRGLGGDEVIRQLNWAEDLHEAIGDYLREHFDTMVILEKLEKLQAKAKKRGKRK